MVFLSKPRTYYCRKLPYCTFYTAHRQVCRYSKGRDDFFGFASFSGGVRPHLLCALHKAGGAKYNNKFFEQCVPGKYG